MSNIIINLHHARFLLTSRNESTSITTFGRASWPYAIGVVFAPHCIRMEHKRSTNIGKISYRVMDQKFVFLRFSISLWTERLGRTQDHNSSWRSWHDWRIHVITGESIALALKELSAGVKFSSSSMLTNNDVVWQTCVQSTTAPIFREHQLFGLAHRAIHTNGPHRSGYVGLLDKLCNSGLQSNVAETVLATSEARFRGPLLFHAVILRIQRSEGKVATQDANFL